MCSIIIISSVQLMCQFFFVVIPLRSLRKLSFTSMDTQVILKVLSVVLEQVSVSEDTLYCKYKFLRLIGGICLH